MEKFTVFEWNKMNKDYTMLILTEKDIKKRKSYAGAGFEIVIVPKKYKFFYNEYVENIIMLAKLRCGRTIYI